MNKDELKVQYSSKEAGKDLEFIVITVAILLGFTF